MLKRFKLIAITALASALVLTSTGCTRPSSVPADNSPDTETSGSKAFNVGVLIPGPVGYFTAVRKGIDEAAAKYNITVQYADAGWDSAKQLSQMEDFVTKKLDMIAVCSVDAEAVKPAVKIANDAKIPVLAFTNAVGTDPSGKYEGLVSYVGQNEVKTGEVCGKIAKKLLGEKGGSFVMLEGRPGTPPQRNRRDGFLNAIKNQSNITSVFTQTANWDREQAMKIVEDLIQKKTDMKLIFAQDDNMAVGAGTALKEAGLKDKVFVIGLGGSTEGLKAVKGGTIDATTYMSAQEEGFKAIETCAKHLKGEKVEPVVEMVQVEVGKDNADKFKGEW